MLKNGRKKRRRTPVRGRLERLETREMLTAEGETFQLNQPVNTAALMGNLSAVVDWGDGTSSNATVSQATGNGQLNVVIRYDRDSNNFFDTQDKRDLLQLAADTLASHFGDDLAAISPGPSGQSFDNTWSARFSHPGTGQPESILDLEVAANTLIIFAGGRDLGGSTLGQGGFGGFSASGTNEFLETVRTRGEANACPDPSNGCVGATDLGIWGGAITFNTTSNWHFGTTETGLDFNESDFLSVAFHEMGHLLGMGTAPSWNTHIVGGQFAGPASVAEYDLAGNVPLAPGGAHWADGVEDNGSETAMDPIITNGSRKLFTPLDWAGLDDVGWDLIDVASTVSATHVYADNGSYDINVTVSDPGGTNAVAATSVTIDNTPPVLTVPGNFSIVVGETLSLLNIGQVSDPGFDNPNSSPTTAETFTYTIDWDDGTPNGSGSATIDSTGSSGSATTASFDGSHVWSTADVYNVTVTVSDDDGGQVSRSFSVTVTDPPPLTLTVTPDAIVESDGAAAAAAVVSRPASEATGDLTVTLTNSDDSEITIPATVVIPDGQTSVTFEIQAVDDTLLDGSRTVTIDAAAPLFQTGSDTVVVADDETLTVTITAAGFAENAGVAAANGTVTRGNTDVAAELIVSLSSSDDTEATVPSTVTIAAGASSATFEIQAVDDALLDGDRPVTIQPAATGYNAVGDTVTVTDHEELTVTIAADSIAENTGPAATTVVITRSDTDSPDSLTVTLASSNPLAAAVQNSVTIGAGQSQVSVPIDAVDDNLLDGTQTLTIAATAAGLIGANDSINVTDHEAVLLELSVSQIQEAGGNATGTVTRTDIDTPGDLIVTLSNPDPSEISMPASVTIPDGSAAITFTIDAVDDGIADDVQTVQISAAATGYEGSNATISVVESGPPFQNQQLPADVDDSGFITSGDALLLVRDLNTNGPRALPTAISDSFKPPPFIDVNGDGRVTPNDALTVIGILRARSNLPIRQVADGEPAAHESATVEPERDRPVGFPFSPAIAPPIVDAPNPFRLDHRLTWAAGARPQSARDVPGGAGRVDSQREINRDRATGERATRERATGERAIGDDPHVDDVWEPLIELIALDCCRPTSVSPV